MPSGVFLGRALGIGVVEAQQEGPAMFAGEEIIEHRRARIANMDAPGGGRRETHDRRDEDGGRS